MHSDAHGQKKWSVEVNGVDLKHEANRQLRGSLQGLQLRKNNLFNATY